MTELKDCPFCWKPGTIWESRELVPGYHDACRAVGCKACAYTLASKSETTTWLETGGVTTNTEEVDALLTSVWNNRVSPWLSLKDDPPVNDNRLILLRGKPPRCGYEQSGIVVDIPGWDGVVHGFARANQLELLSYRYQDFTEYMEIPT